MGAGYRHLLVEMKALRNLGLSILNFLQLTWAFIPPPDREKGRGERPIFALQLRPASSVSNLPFNIKSLCRVFH